MRGLLAAVIPVVAVVVAGGGGAARAQQPSATAPKPNVCEPVERALAERDKELADRERELARAQSQVQKLSSEKRALGEEIAAMQQKLADEKAEVQSCQAGRDALCGAVGDFARGITQGRVVVGSGLPSCVPSSDQAELATLLGGWERAQAVLSALAAYEAGESDVAPGHAGATRTPAERIAHRLVAASRGGPALFTRRLLVEALLRVAPRAWRKLRAGGTAALDAWFAGTAPLDRAIVAEAQGEAEEANAAASGGGPTLSTALDLVQAFQTVTGCGAKPKARGCARATQLAELLETSGPIVVRRRLQDIWATDCGAIGSPSVVAGWVVDFPSSTKSRESDWHEVTEAAFAKLYTCFLADPSATSSLSEWVGARLPRPSDVGERVAARVDVIRAHLRTDARADARGDVRAPYERCAQAARALQLLPAPTACSMAPRVREVLSAWANHPARKDEANAPLPLRACANYVRLLWEGHAAAIPASFARPPVLAELVVADAAGAQGDSATLRLRNLCDRRMGAPQDFPDDVARLAEIAQAFGEPPAGPPWRVDPTTHRPVEEPRLREALQTGPWLKHVLARGTACEAMQLGVDRCKLCGELGDAAYDCALVGRVQARWRARSRVLFGWVAVALAVAFAVGWSLRMLRALRRFGEWARRVGASLEALGIPARPDPFRFVLPSRMQLLRVELPHGAGWERWGRRASVVGASSPTKVTDRDVSRAALWAAAMRAEVAILVHDEGASPDLAAVRAMLEWAAKPGGRAVHVLLVSTERLKWARSGGDLLDLMEETSLRGNPFEVRGRITSSSQFWNRERLVSGLLASAEAGRWVVVTGLRRFGKSSLALEIARRLPGAAAYVDLSGFHHEIAVADDAARAADAILRFLCMQLHESATSRLGPLVSSALPEPPAQAAVLDTAELQRWMRAFTSACTRASGARGMSFLLILDELEQAIGAGPERLGRALDALAVVLGRLRGALQGPVAPTDGARVGLLLCSALHPALWAPLATLAHQSLMGALEHVSVPCLSTEAAESMMRGLGARQGIRFSDEALALIVAEAQGVPLLVRRLGSSVLELYDPERARSGALGAVNVGVEGAAAAVRREAEEGSPLRVWVESEIADPESIAGLVLRRLAKSERVATAELRELVKARVLAQFAATGIAATLTPEEAARRAAEAAGVLVRLVGDTGLLVPEGDLTNPEAYRLPEGLLRRILGNGGATAS
jgi:hypothetical protein